MSGAKRISIAALVLLATGASAGAAPSSWQRAVTPSGQVELRFPPDWVRDHETDYDLRYLSKNKHMTTGVSEWLRADVAADAKPKDLLQLTVDNIREAAKRFVVVQPEKAIRDGDRTITTVVYAGEEGLKRFYYRCVLIEFAATKDVFLVLVQVAIPSEWSESDPVLAAIAQTATLRGK